MIEIIDPADYTSQIEHIIAKLKHRMDSTLVEYSEDDILVVENDGTIYVLANPVVGREPLYDEFGRIQEWIPLRNITLVWMNDRLSFERNRLSRPELRIIRPDLCTMILPDGIVTDGGFVAEMGPVGATHRIMAENTGQGDSVKELENVWGDMSVFQIYEQLRDETNDQR